METYLKSKPKDYGHLVGRIGVRENRENRGQGRIGVRNLFLLRENRGQEPFSAYVQGL